jgi:hypothetical protein
VDEITYASTVRLLIFRIEIDDTVTDEILWRMQNINIVPRTKSQREFLDSLTIQTNKQPSKQMLVNQDAHTEHYTTDIHIYIYPAMTAFTDQYSLPNIFFDIGQL